MTFASKKLRNQQKQGKEPFSRNAKFEQFRIKNSAQKTSKTQSPKIYFGAEKSNKESVSSRFSFDSENQILIFGKNPVILAISSKRRKIYCAFATQKVADELKSTIDPSANLYFWKVLQIVESATISQICGSDQNHQNLAITASKLVMSSQFDLLSKLHDISNPLEMPNLLVLDQLLDPQNVGAIVRSAIAFGFCHILFCAHNCAKESSAMIKASAGMSEFAEFYVLSNLNDALLKLKKIGYWCAGLASEGEFEVEKLSNHKPIALVIGSEGTGLRNLVKKNCDFLVKIKTASEVESLNASVAAAIAMQKIYTSN
jgi:23S rRNA (guanosine2251-2'-O)-methyltransferase